MHKYTNHLIHETSPYLLQHAHNPVDWYPWSEKALNRAKEENKPILVSIGYAACHWCHVMERESFEDEATARIMNEHFVNIKIDREERPDLDHIYMDAVQAMAGSGGWPLNVFLTPEAKPFYGGTYFPPRRAFNRPSWQEILQGVVQAFNERRHEIDAQAENLTEHLLQSNSFGMQQIESDEIFKSASLEEMFRNIMKSADTEWGGFGKAPKFPQTFSIQFLLRYHLSEQYPVAESPKPPLRQERGLGGEALTQALLSLDKMIEGGIYDQLGGGFARYSTDTEWLAPHFEKMLYDNALLLSVISEAFQLTGKERYQEVIHETMEFIQREMMHPQKGFYAALDADSEGVEGKFYVWDSGEIKELLGNDAALFSAYYDISEKGNWEGKNILRVKQTVEEFAEQNKIQVKKWKELLTKNKIKLLERRATRIRPALDDKIILGWNALMNTACSKAFAATGYEPYRQLAIDNMQFLLSRLKANNENEFHHTWKNDEAKYPAFLDDYAFLVQALLHLHEITGDANWLQKAKDITGFVQSNFKEENTGFFFYTGSGQSDVIIRKKEVYDGAVPSGNSVMAFNLYQLSILFDIPAWKDQSLGMLRALGNAITKYPTSFGNWGSLFHDVVNGVNEIVVLGKGALDILPSLLKKYIPNRVIMASETPLSGYPLMSGKLIGNKISFFLCRNYTCQAPVFSLEELTSLIHSAPQP